MKKICIIVLFRCVGTRNGGFIADTNLGRAVFMLVRFVKLFCLGDLICPEH